MLYPRVYFRVVGHDVTVFIEPVFKTLAGSVRIQVGVPGGSVDVDVTDEKVREVTNGCTDRVEDTEGNLATWYVEGRDTERFIFRRGDLSGDSFDVTL